jgi:hypothetical protein
MRGYQPSMDVSGLGVLTLLRKGLRQVPNASHGVGVGLAEVAPQDIDGRACEALGREPSTL